MICFGVETERNEKKGTCGSHTTTKKIKRIREEREADREGNIFIFIFIFFLSLLSSIYENRTVRIRRGKKQIALLNEGYAWEPKTRDFAEFLIKIRKSSVLVFLRSTAFCRSELVGAEGQIDPRITSYA